MGDGMAGIADGKAGMADGALVGTIVSKSYETKTCYVLYI